MPFSSSFPVRLAGIFGLTGVALGAFGAHALKGRLEETGHAETWETAVLYQLSHAVALLAVGAWNVLAPTRARLWAAGCWSLGILAFSGSLYLLSLGGPRWLGPVTPLGGLALMAGWVCAMVGARSQKS